MIYLFLSLVACIIFFFFWISSPRFPWFFAFLLLFFLVLCSAYYFPSSSLPDSIVYIDYFSGLAASSQVGAWDFSMILYSRVIYILSLGVLDPLQMLVFARALNLFLYILFFFLASGRSVRPFILMTAWFFTSLYPYNCIFQLRAGLAYLAVLYGFLLFWNHYSERLSPSFSPSTLRSSLISWNKSPILQGPSTTKFRQAMNMFLRFRLQHLALAILLLLITIFLAAFLHLSVVSFLLAIFLSVLVLYRVPMIGSGWRILFGLSVVFSIFLAVCFSIINSSLSSSIQSLLLDSGQNYAYGALQLAESAGPAQYTFQFIRSFFFLALAMALARNLHATTSRLLIWPTLFYVSLRPALVPFFSIARILSPILLLQTFLLPLARKSLHSKTEVIILGFVGLFVASLQSYQSFINLS